MSKGGNLDVWIQEKFYGNSAGTLDMVSCADSTQFLVKRMHTDTERFNYKFF